jgi:hypothetical protein
MQRRLRFHTPAGLVVCLLLAGCATTQDDDAEAERIRQIERERLSSLVDVDLPAARRLHSDDFQLINPAGVARSKDEYLGALESGQLDYVAWDPGEIAVRLYKDVAVIRYRDIRFDVNFGTTVAHRGPMYHTNVYERRGGQWLIVWSQASGVITP